MNYSRGQLAAAPERDLRAILGYLHCRVDGRRAELIERILGVQSLTAPWVPEHLSKKELEEARRDTPRLEETRSGAPMGTRRNQEGQLAMRLEDNNNKSSDNVQATTEVKEKPSAVAANKKKLPEPRFRALRTVEELLDAYNEMVAEAVRLKLTAVRAESFKDVATAVSACERLHAQITKTRKSPAKSKSGQEEEEVMRNNTAAKARGTKSTTRSKARGAVKKTAKTRAKFDGGAKIHWNFKGKDGQTNPFREGSGRFKRVEKLRAANGRTVDTYLEKGGRIATLSFCRKAGFVKVA